MAIPQRHLREIQERSVPSEIIGEYVKLRKRGQKDSGEWIGLCPFHNERTPSFTVTDRKSFFHCFGCGSHGRVEAFLMKVLGVSFEEAMLQIAARYHIKVPSGKTNTTKKKLKDRAKRKKRLEVKRIREERQDASLPSVLWDEPDLPF